MRTIRVERAWPVEMRVRMIRETGRGQGYQSKGPRRYRSEAIRADRKARRHLRGIVGA